MDESLAEYFEGLARQKSGKNPITAPGEGVFNESPTAALLAKDLASNPFAYAPFTGLTLMHRANQNRYLDELGNTNAVSALMANNQAEMGAATEVFKTIAQHGLGKGGMTPGLLRQVLGGMGMDLSPEDLSNLNVGFRTDQMKGMGEASDKFMQAGMDPTGAVNQQFGQIGLPLTTPTEPTSVRAAAASGGGQGKIMTTLPNGQQTNRPEKYPGEIANLEAQGRSARADARARLDGSKPAPAQLTAPAQAPTAPTQPTANSIFGQEATGTLADNNVRRLIATFKLKDPNAEANVKVNRVPGQHAYFIHAPNGKTYTCDIHGCRKNP